MNPVQVVLHGGGAEAYGVPVLQVRIDQLRAPGELLPGLVVFPVVIEAVNAHFEAVFDQGIPQNRTDVIAPGHEIEGRPETQAFFQFHELPAPALPSLGVRIVGEHHGEALAFGPALPIRRFCPRFLVNGPYVRMSRQQPGDIFTPEIYLERSGDEGFQFVIDIAKRHRIIPCGGREGCRWP